MTGNGGTEKGPGGVATVSAAISYSNVITVLPFAGGNYTNIPDGAMAATLPTACPLIPQGAVFYFRTYYTNGAGVILNQNGTGPLEYSAFGTTGADHTQDTSIPGSVGTGNYSYGPIAILGTTIKPSILILGDSRDWGVGDVNYFNTGGGAMPTFANGIARLFVPYYGYCNVSCPGDIWTTYTSATNRMYFTNFATFVWTDLGINEWQGGTPSLLLQHATNFYRLFSVPVCVETLSPYTTSSDGWFTLANQTVNASDTYRTNFNALLRNHMMPNVSHYCDVAWVTESDSINAQNSGKWNIWATTNINGYALASRTNMTVDGLHGNYFGELAAGMGDPLKQETPYIWPGVFPVVLTASGTFTGNGASLTNLTVPTFTNAQSVLTSGQSLTVQAYGRLHVSLTLTNAVGCYLTNLTSHTLGPSARNYSGVWTNDDELWLDISVGDSVLLTNDQAGGAGVFLRGSEIVGTKTP